MGAKNHAIVMPDAEKEDTINAIIGACFGSTGQRCMAIAVVVMVGDSVEWIPEIVERTRGLSIGAGVDNADIGPLNNPEQLAKVEALIEDGAQNCDVLLDGRGVQVEGYPKGNWIGPTIIDHVKPGFDCYDKEVFGPVMQIVRCDSLQNAIDFVNANPWGNGSTIFTASGITARKFQTKIEAGQIGINLPIPVPLPMFSFTGNKASMWGTSNFFGKGAI